MSFSFQQRFALLPFMKMQASRWPPRSVAAVARLKLIAVRRSAPTLPPRPPFSFAVVNLKRSWGTFMGFFCCGLLTASAQVSHQVSSTPTDVIRSGKAEVMGEIRLMVFPAATQTSTSSAIFITYPGVAIDNLFSGSLEVPATGTLATPGGINLSLTGGYINPATPVTVSASNSTGGGVLGITIPAGLTLNAGDAIFVDGVRGDVTGLPSGSSVLASLSATPANAHSFLNVSEARVAMTNPGLVISTQATPNCGVSTITVTEGFPSAFVQTTPPPPAARPSYGASANTQVHILVGGILSNMTLNWPDTVSGTGSGSLTKISQDKIGTDVVYEFRTSNQGDSDIQKESFPITPSLIPLSLPCSGVYTTVQAQLWPAASTSSRPRFDDPFTPDPADQFQVRGACQGTTPGVPPQPPRDRSSFLNRQSLLKPTDFNSDGHPDILWRNDSTGENKVWLMNGTVLSNSVSLRTVPDLNWKIVATADFNGDNKVDLLWRNLTTGQNAVWFLNGTTLTGNGYLNSVPDLNWKLVGAADFNGDGNVDLLWRNTATGQNAVWFMNGIAFASHAYLTAVADPNWKIVGTGDFNGDGKVDILWRDVATGENSVWFMNGTSIIGKANLTSVADPNWKIVGTGDFNGDGKLDILWRNLATGQNAVWFMNGTDFVDSAFLDSLTDLNWVIEGNED